LTHEVLHLGAERGDRRDVRLILLHLFAVADDVLGLRRVNLLRPPALDVREPAVGERDLLRVRLRASDFSGLIERSESRRAESSGASGASRCFASRFLPIETSLENPKKKKVVCLQMRHPRLGSKARRRGSYLVFGEVGHHLHGRDHRVTLDVVLLELGLGADVRDDLCGEGGEGTKVSTRAVNR
jgi:hypothetical protein